jgi:Zn-dependent oligopeptidase
MAKSPERVIEFLTRVDAGLLPKARSEVARLAPLGEKDGIASLAASDLSFYNERLRRTQFAVDAEQVRQYFPVDHVVPAVLGIYQELLGLRFTEVKPADVWAPGVRQFTVHDATTSASLGTVYLDLFPRANKYSHFANFPLRATYRRTDGTRQPPVTAIIGNWPEGAPGKPALLSHGDVLTFFHEFGHAMSAVSDQSPYLTTGALQLRPDFVEALSQMLENWMWEPRVLKRISHHVATGESLPDSLIQRMIALKHFSDGINGTQQAFLAMYDMTLHSSGPTVDPNTMWTKLEGELTALPSVPNAIPVAGFGHLMGGYDAGYYGYLWSRVYAQDLFTRFEKDGVMNATVGRAYRDLILAPSATEEPDVLLKRFLGRTLSYDAFFRDMGIK